MVFRAAFFLMLLIAPVLVSMPALAEQSEKVVMRAPSPAPGAPSKVVKEFYDVLLDTMKKGPELGFQGRATKLSAAVRRAFNLSDMTRTSVGLNWVKTSPEEKDKLVKAFSDFSVGNYASQYKKFDGESFAIKGEKPGPNAGEVIVETSLTSGADTTEFNYLMRRNNAGAWQIEDIYVNGTISEMATRRSEFSTVVRDGGVDSLINLLNQKSEQLSNS